MQDVDLQSPSSQVSLEAAWCRGTTRAADGPSAAPVPFRLSPMLETVSQTAKVMIVDDEPVNVKVVQKYLKLAGYRHFVTSTDPQAGRGDGRAARCPTSS